ncbi:hypothetical protein G6M89_20875 [Natronolimnobius sp. AArcel1]|uniref:hypothetical protein n=1 Tax=Natronolimnobius sp. AArcel1 TaxID=1679093 RepID=UPI0013EC8DC7|nr:hypothetical protein [Natronolimnobius sp. AArcel1]NGM71416.1 hypothetical protein [Natronolimnobius sp. AArcel1]
MSENATRNDVQSEDTPDETVAVYRHDAHKMNGQSHEDAPKTFAGVPVNQTVPYGADGDASALSRPSGQPEQTVENHETHYRLSLIEGESRYNPQEFTHNSVKSAIRDLLTEDDPEAMHRAWLNSDVVSAFNESVYYPYTSLKYHTLLVAALFDNYRADHEFAGLHLVVDDADEIVPHRTVYADEYSTLRIDVDTGRQPAARLGSRPWRSWASVWNRLPAHPLETNHDKYDMVLDTNLRRIGSWSTALQYIEDFREAFDQ